ncbi:NUDIX hydrolase [Thalassococcus lentus]|uniref:NUDIX hydrolase n=1 Tax=Thalassococcus lentus TaxID=1210524 RepID=A0ABT4XP07_9RHOB|nr:NUDIX hydrolase [Thalassococcus lentus]MDA7423681.1 NUDIX hydrolase [Thalassococcus lentus]
MWLNNEDFTGAKIMVFAGKDLLVLHRDHTPGISWPGYLDLPGGGREGQESPLHCALRELREELGLTVSEVDTIFAHRRVGETGVSYFYAAHLDHEIRDQVVFGNEGAGWAVMPPSEFAGHPNAIPHFARIVSDYWNAARDQ